MEAHERIINYGYRQKVFIIKIVKDKGTMELWHKRLNHISLKGLTILANKNMFSRVQNALLKKCSHYLVGKQNKVAFKSSPLSRMQSTFDLVYSDLCYLMKTKTLGGALYFVTLIDDHSRKIWVYMLKTKNQVLDVFKKF